MARARGGRERRIVKRGELYRLRHPTGGVKRSRVVVVVSRQGAIDSALTTVMCAPIYTERLGMGSTVSVGVDEGLKHDSSVRCDLITSVAKSALTAFVGELGPEAIERLGRALRVALEVECDGNELPA